MASTTTAKTTDPRTRKTFSTARIIALVLIGLVAFGLAYLKLKPGAEAVTVPAGARAGQLVLKPGTYETENGACPADIGTLVVQEDRHDPHSRLIALPVVRIKARSSSPGEPIFRLEGGPGSSNMHFAMASRFARDHDVVLVGYRGVDGSSVLDAPEVVSALQHSSDFLSPASFRAYGDALRSAARRLRAEGVDLAGYTMSEQADDLEAARTALGYDRIDLLSESAGTRLALIYAWRHPESVRRSVMIGVNPPGHFLWDGRTTDAQIERYSRLFAQSDEARGGTTGDLAASMRYTTRHMPRRWMGLPIKEGNVKAATFLGLMESTSKASPFAGPSVLEGWRSAANGDAAGLWLSSLIAEVMFPTFTQWGEYAAIGSADAEAARDYFSAGGPSRGSIIGDPGAAFAWSGGILADAWPANPDDGQYAQARTSDVETLLIGGTLDFATPPGNATTDLLPFLPNGHQVVLSELGHSGSFWNERPEAAGRLVDTFFDSGTVDDSGYGHVKVDFTPAVTFATIAKIVAGSMLGLAVVAVASLLWMWSRARRHVAFGRKKAAVLRALSPFVLGLGAWCLGALLVMVTDAPVPLVGVLPAVLCTGVPTGLAIHWVRVRDDEAAGGRTVALVLAVAAALSGAWLGFHVTQTFVAALVFGIAGATAAANLALIVLDIVRERPAARPAAERQQVTTQAAWVPAGPAGQVRPGCGSRR